VGNGAAVFGQAEGNGAGVSGNANGNGAGVSGNANGVGRGVIGTNANGNGDGVVGVTGQAGLPGAGGTSGVLGISHNRFDDSNGVFGQCDVNGAGNAIHGRGGTNAGFFEGHVQINGSVDVSNDLTVTNLTVTGAKHFAIDHPCDPENKFLYHCSVESPEMMNVYSGNVTTDAGGEAWVALPNYFEALNCDFRYQLTVIGQFSQAIVATEIAKSRFLIRTDKPKVKVSWLVSGVRKDAYAKANPVSVEKDKSGAEKGFYLHPHLYAQASDKALTRLDLHPQRAH
jgi:hypothetical protein